jgi:hypothetical protein
MIVVSETKTVFIGQLQTTNFEFLICGDSEAHVIELAEAAWKKHRKDTGARWEWADVADSLYVLKMQPGQVQKN